MLKYKGEWCLLELSSEQYFTQDLITDWVIEDVRVKSRRSDTELSPHDYWQQHRDEVKAVAQNDPLGATPHNLREALWKLAPEAGTFRPTVAVALMRRFNMTRVIDMSAGWGDRLVAAMATNGVVEYWGTDPNTDLEKRYLELAGMFAPRQSSQYTVLASKFEDAEIPHSDFDGSIISPPFLDLELYTGGDQNVPDMTLEEFIDWLVECLRKITRHLQIGSRLCLNMNDIRNGAKYTETIVRRFTGEPNIEYEGAIGFGEIKYRRGRAQLRSTQPLWIFRKTA
jgi:hypothetical protein